MQSNLLPQSGASRLRCVFGDAVISFALDARPTLGDIALMLSEPILTRHGKPLAIDLAWPGLKPRGLAPGRQMAS